MLLKKRFKTDKDQEEPHAQCYDTSFVRSFYTVKFSVTSAISLHDHQFVFLGSSWDT